MKWCFGTVKRTLTRNQKLSASGSEVLGILLIKLTVWLWVLWISSLMYNMGKQIVIYPYKKLLWSNKKEWTTTQVTSWINIKITVLDKRIEAQKICIVWFHFYEVLDKTCENQNSDCLGGGGIKWKVAQGIWGGMEMGNVLWQRYTYLSK